MQTIDQVAVNTLRFLSIDEVEKAKSGHPGFPLGTAPLMYTVWDRFMNYNPKDPNWFNRDRFILSPGHGSALYYAMLHLAGYDVSIEQLKNFRQWGSITPGHPEYGVTPGVDASTGPLGHGFAMGVGFAIAETMLAAKYNKPGFEVINHYTYGLTSDGDQMEGVASEAASLAGTLGLGKLFIFMMTTILPLKAIPKLLSAKMWANALKHTAGRYCALPIPKISTLWKMPLKKPRPIPNIRALLLYVPISVTAAPKQDNASCLANRLAPKALPKTKEAADWPVGQSFYVPVTVRKHFDDKLAACAEKQAAWEALLADYKVVYPELGKELEERIKGDVLVSRSDLEAVFNDIEGISTREAGGEVLQKLSMQLPQLVGGSADLGPSNKTVMKTCGYYSKDDRTGRNIHFWRARTRYGQSTERYRAARRLHSVWRHLPCICRFYAPGSTHGCTDGPAFHLCIYARQHCRWRGRAYAPAGRACYEPARYSQFVRYPPGRCFGNRYGMADSLPEPA